jgi:hypothetical protein
MEGGNYSSHRVMMSDVRAVAERCSMKSTQSPRVGEAAAAVDATSVCLLLLISCFPPHPVHLLG